MFNIIKKIFRKKEYKTQSPIIDNEYHILLSYNKEKNDISLTIDYESILEKAGSNFYQDTADIAQFLYSVCNNKTLLASLVLDNLREYKKIATEKAYLNQDTDSLLFANSIISNLESILTLSKTTNIDDPLIKPIQVFHNAN